MKGFLDFVREQGVVGLAVGLAIGVAATAAVAEITAGLIDPLVGWLLSFIFEDGSSLAAYEWVISEGDNPLVIGWGAILSGAINLVAVAFVVYYIVKQLGLDKLDKEKK